ncbi:DUF6479 family protein [Streptomyces sp. NPDC048111]|uniref:DUF6479 family protein n=1 Tax=Streptomyces sp. NPDC048111 TaxID=3365500 RepID=UPI00370FFCC8
MTLTDAAPQVVAVGHTAALLMIIVGAVVVVGLLAMFWTGRRRAARMSLPPTHQPGEDSWQTPEESQGRPGEREGD